MTIDLKPGESTLIGHDAGDDSGVNVSLALGDEVLVRAVAPPKRFARSIPGSTGVVDFLIKNKSLLNPASDAVGLLTGGGPTSTASPSWVNGQVTKLRAAFGPELTIFAQTSGVYDVKRLAEGCPLIDAVALVQETGFGVEDTPLPSDLEKWDPAQAAVEKRLKAAKVYTDAAGKKLILHMSGKGVPWRSDDIPTWDYSRFAAIVGDSFPNVLQTQRDYQSAHETGNDRVIKGHALIRAQVPTWLDQVTLDPSEVNGITRNTGGDPADAFLAQLAKAEAATGRLAGVSLWSLDATGLAKVLTVTKDWVVA